MYAYKLVYRCTYIYIFNSIKLNLNFSTLCAILTETIVPIFVVLENSDSDIDENKCKK